MSQPAEMIHDLVVGEMGSDGGLTPFCNVGQAFQFLGEDHWVLSLMMFPNHYYYLCRDPESELSYSVFSRKCDRSIKPRFMKKVGDGKLNEVLKTHLELRLPLLPQSIFMSIFPKRT